MGNGVVARYLYWAFGNADRVNCVLWDNDSYGCPAQ